MCVAHEVMCCDGSINVAASQRSGAAGLWILTVHEPNLSAETSNVPDHNDGWWLSPIAMWLVCSEYIVTSYAQNDKYTTQEAPGP